MLFASLSNIVACRRSTRECFWLDSSIELLLLTCAIDLSSGVLFGGTCGFRIVTVFVVLAGMKGMSTTLVAF